MLVVVLAYSRPREESQCNAMVKGSASAGTVNNLRAFDANTSTSIQRLFASNCVSQSVVLNIGMAPAAARSCGLQPGRSNRQRLMLLPDQRTRNRQQ